MNGYFPTWVKVIATVGFPIAVSIYLGIILYPVILRVDATVLTNGSVAEQLAEQGRQQIKLLTGICRNVAKNEYDKSNCDIK